MNVLVFSPTATHPTYSGSSQRVFSICSALQALGHKVHFVYFDHERKMDLEQAEAMRAAWDSFHYIPYHPRRRRSFTGPDWKADDWYQDDIGPTIAELCRVYRPEAVLCNYVFQSKLLEDLPPEIIRIIDTHDTFADRRQMMERAGLKPSFYFTTRSDEARMIRRADVVIAIQDHEARYFRSITASPVVTIGQFLPPLPPPAKPPAGKMRFGYIASGNHLNVASLRALIAAVDALPRVEFRVIVAGTVCEKVQDIARPWLQFLGVVPEPADFYTRILAAINPMSHGTGLKIKTVEALRWGMPVVSTACGFAGLQSAHAAHGLEDAQGVAATMAALALSEDLCDLREASRQAFEAYHSEQSAAFHGLFASPEALRSTLGGPAALAAGRARKETAILMVSHAKFWARTYGSHHRIRDLLAQCAQRYRVAVFIAQTLTAEDRREIAALGLPIEVHGMSQSSTLFQNMSSTEKMLGLQAEERVLAEFRECVRQFAPDLCIVEYLRMAFLVDALPDRCVRIIDTHDLISRREESRAIARGTTPAVTRRAEIAALSRFDFLIAIQRTEMAVLTNWGFRQRVVYCPVRVSHQPRSVAGPAKVFGFIGGDMEANLDGLQWFLQNVWPFFSRFPVSLKIAGKVCEKLPPLPFSNVEVLGFVDSEDAFFESIDVLINPVHWGGGLKIKVAQAMGMGVPVLGTSEAAAGCEEAVGHGIVLADTARDFILSLWRLIRDEAFFRTQAAEAAAFAAAEFTDLQDDPLFGLIENASPARHASATGAVR
jgi:glycosyltransferase involved in cell wall biosynthesis